MILDPKEQTAEATNEQQAAQESASQDQVMGATESAEEGGVEG
jgi:hypothetical protein